MNEPEPLGLNCSEGGRWGFVRRVLAVAFNAGGCTGEFRGDATAPAIESPRCLLK
jgi:hypothetical protein